MENSRPIPRFNHVAVSVPPDDLDARGREQLLGFYGEVFGWTEMPTLTRDRELLVLRVHSNEQFVFIQASADPMRCSGGEHFGIQVSSPEELDEVLARAKRVQASDAQVEIDERRADDFVALKLHSFYVRYRLPLKVEVQCFEWAPGFSAASGAD